MHGLSSAKKTKLLKLYGINCFYCGDLLTIYPSRPVWEADHIVPKSKGGNDSLKNLVPSCRNCNAMKLDLTMKEWFIKMRIILKRHTDEEVEKIDEAAKA